MLLVLLVPAVFLAVFGGPVLVAWLWIGTHRRRCREVAERGVHVMGVVVQRTEAVASDADVDAISVEFLDESGRWHRVQSRIGSSRMPPVGTPTEVHYFRESPELAVLEIDRKNFDLVGKVLLATLVFVVALGVAGGVALYWVARDYL